ncbi:family 43 glycosylhydrolase [Streptococcaceae bacterium ESL0687]|nr:family 43 glycosylhydrolase [Streptococcaceae bacterium ESL0687]
MTTIQNPIMAGMVPDPSAIRVGEDYYVATSTFHWTPGVPIFHSKDLANWELVTNVLTGGEIDLRGTDTPAGIWAPNLSYDEVTKKFWMTYCQMVNMSGREFNANTYTMWADEITGPWSEPQYVTSIGIDPSLFHDEDGKKYLAVLEWESRVGYPSPGRVVIAEYDAENGQIIGDWKRVSSGFTTRGCVEAPYIWKRNGYYYLILASGGTGYGHGVEIGRSKDIFGPYEAHPSMEPILTSSPAHLFSLGDPDAGHFEMYNPHSRLQKSGHGSLVQTPTGEWYMFHLMSRPLEGKLLNPLGRETSIQEMTWTDEGWLEMKDGSNLAKEFVQIPYEVTLPSTQKDDINENFGGAEISGRFMTPYHFKNNDWVKQVNNKLEIYGRDSLFSKVTPSIMGTRASSFDYEVETRLTFKPDHYSQKSGLGLYYDANDWLFAHLTYSEQYDMIMLSLSQARLGERIEYIHDNVAVPEGEVSLKIAYKNAIATVFYRIKEEDEWVVLMADLDVDYLSDEGVNGTPGEIGGFTGLVNFMGSVDSYQHKSCGQFDYYRVSNL